MIRDKYELWLQQHSESSFFGTPCIFLSFSEDVITLTKPFPPGEIAGAQPVIKSGSRKNQRATWEKRESTDPSSQDYSFREKKDS